jgi:hypothetical protein
VQATLAVMMMMMMMMMMSPENKASEERTERQNCQPNQTGNGQRVDRVRQQCYALTCVGVNVLLMVYALPAHDLRRKTQAFVLPRVGQGNSPQQQKESGEGDASGQIKRKLAGRLAAGQESRLHAWHFKHGARGGQPWSRTDTTKESTAK